MEARAAEGPASPVFLRAEWRHLVMLNYEIDASLVRPRLPHGTELDLLDGRCLCSMVGFLFLDTRVLGVAVPFHRNFEEVNLRFYVRHKAGAEWRRGVVFVKEVVPRLAIAAVARVCYGENYVALPMKHEIRTGAKGEVGFARYTWGRGDQCCAMEFTAQGLPEPMVAGSAEEFIAEHYWGYAARRGGGSTEYAVEHPRWNVARARVSRLEGDLSRHYGAAFAEALASTPHSAFLADGSPILVRRGRRLA